MKVVACALGILLAGVAQAAPNNTGRGLYANPMPEKKADTSVMVKIVKAVKASASTAGKEAYCAGGKPNPGPVVTSAGIAGIDETGAVKISLMRLDVKHCGGENGTETLQILGSEEALDADESRKLSRMLNALEKKPQDCAISMKMSAKGKLLDLKGCEG